MYHHLFSNGPKEVLELADYSFDEHFKKPIGSFPPRLVLRDYFMGRAAKMGNLDNIKLNHTVRNVTFDQAAKKYQVTVWDKANDNVFTKAFDHVVVSSGHFSVPYLPELDGLNDFQGRVIHGHDFKDAEQFRG